MRKRFLRARLPHLLTTNYQESHQREIMTNVATSTEPLQAPGVSSIALPPGLDRAKLIEAFRLMYLSRSLDDREILLKRQNKIFFQISGAGHEAIGVAAGMVLRPGVDWLFAYYRDRAMALALGLTAEDMLLEAVGAARDPNSGGRQMPSHWSLPALNIFTASSPTGTQFLQAAGCAQAKRYLDPESDEITMVCSGEGATSEGEFWECLNVACIERLPLLVLIEDNGYAISVPIECQTAGANIARLVEGFPGMLRLEVDGTNFVESFRSIQQAAEYCRSGQGPAFVRATVTRPYSHSLSDDERLYKPESERREESSRDPLTTFPELLIRDGFLDREEVKRITREVDQEVKALSERLLQEPAPRARLRHAPSLFRQSRSMLTRFRC